METLKVYMAHNRPTYSMLDIMGLDILGLEFWDTLLERPCWDGYHLRVGLLQLS